MKLHTEVKFSAAERKIDYSSKITFLGSCFSETIGGRLEGLKFDAKPNVLGIAYNPISIAKQIQMAFDSSAFAEEKILETNGKFVHLDFHSDFNKKSAAEFSIQAKNKINQLERYLTSGDFIFITLGTAIVFRTLEGEVANNCHKIPQSEFKKEMLSLEQMEQSLGAAIQAIGIKNPEAQIILTVSPIRHLRHGAIENNRSKARLLQLCENLEIKNKNCTYLPIYEYVMDELRDYRFYRQDDLIHLNELAIDLIMEKCKAAVISENAYELMARVAKWKKLLGHKIEDAQSDSAKVFLEKCFSETRTLNELIPRRFDNELSALQMLVQK